MDAYLLTKSLHIISMVCWFAMLFYMPRLFVHHAENADKKGKKLLEMMAHKLYRLIGTPAMVATWLFGVLLVVQNPAVATSGGWFHVKILLVLGLSAYHASLNVFRKQLVAGTCKKSGKFFRIYNEIPSAILVIVVTLAVLKPF